MRGATPFLLAIIVWSSLACVREQPEAGVPIQIVSTEVNHELPDGSKAAPGTIFLTIHASHPSKSEHSCELGWPDLILVDDKGVTYRSKQSTESRGLSSSSAVVEGPREKVKPHQLWAVYELPADGVSRNVFIKGYGTSRLTYSAR